jgi:8-oxo-dGTP diphosphatase
MSQQQQGIPHEGIERVPARGYLSPGQGAPTASSAEGTYGQQPLRMTPVVSCFLMRFDQDEPRLLIVQRSQRVGSYQGRWAAISGFIEEGVTPEEQAYTEIREETNLQREQVRLLRRGAVIEYSDAAIGRHWLIHPFLWEVLSPEAIHTDWEAQGMRWIHPSELRDYETVPLLVEAYASAEEGEKV